MSPTAQFESSGLKHSASKNRKPDKALSDLMDLNEDLEDLLEGEIDTGDSAPPAPKPAAKKRPQVKPASRSAKSAASSSKSKEAQRKTSRATSSKSKQPASSAKIKAVPAKKKPQQRSSSRPTASRSRLPQRKSKTHDLKATAAPLLATVGLLLLIPAFWSVLLLADVDVPGSAREDSRPMAAVMLACWPIAICLIVAAFIFFKQTIRAKKEMKLARARR